MFNPFPNDKILVWPKLRALADDKMNAAEIMISLSDTVENVVGKRENAGYQNAFKIPLFQSC